MTIEAERDTPCGEQSHQRRGRRVGKEGKGGKEADSGTANSQAQIEPSSVQRLHIARTGSEQRAQYR
jgi:hypothetical protein